MSINDHFSKLNEAAISSHQALEHRLYFFIGVMAELRAVMLQENALLKSDATRNGFRDPMFIARKQKLCEMYEALAGDIMVCAREGKIHNKTLKECLIERMHELRAIMLDNSQKHEVIMHDMQSRVDNVMTRIQAHEADTFELPEETEALRSAAKNGGVHVTH